MKTFAWVAACLLLALTPASHAAGQPLAEAAVPSEADLADARVVAEAFLGRVMEGRAETAVTTAFSGSPLEYQTAQLQALIDTIEAYIEYYGQPDGWEALTTDSRGARLVHMDYLVHADNGPFVVNFYLHKRSSGWSVLMLQVNDQIQALFSHSPIGPPAGD